MAKPQNNRERLLLIRKGLERILDEYRGERKRWLDTLGDSSDLPTLRFDTKIKAVDNLLTELATVLYTLCREEGEGEGSQETRKLRSEETAKGAEEDRGGVPRIEYVKPTVTEGKRTGEKCKITDPDNGSVDREGNFVCVSEETADAMNRARLRELMELPNAHPSVAEKLGKWFASQKGKGRNRLVIVGGRWEVLERTTPSGKTLFRCKVCLRESVSPDKECPTMDCEGIEKRFQDSSDLSRDDMALLGKLVATGKVTYSEALKQAKEDCGCGAPECPVCGLSELASVADKMFVPFQGLSGNLDSLDFKTLKVRKPNIKVGIDGEKIAEATRAQEIEEGTTAGGELLCWARGVGCPPIPCRLIPGQCGVVSVNETGEEMVAVPFVISEPFGGGKEVSEKLGEYLEFDKRNQERLIQTFGDHKQEGASEKLGAMIRREARTGSVEHHPGLLIPPFNDKDVDAESKRRATEIENELATAAREGKEIVKVDRMGNRETILPAKRALIRKLDRVKRGAQGFNTEPETLEDAIALRGEGVKDRIAATEAESLLRVGAGSMASKHTAEDTTAVRTFVYRALELPYPRRTNLFLDLKLVTKEEAKLSDLEVIKIAFRNAKEGGRAKMEELITAVNKLYSEFKK